LLENVFVFWLNLFNNFFCIYSRVNLVNLPQSILVSCLLELKLDEALVQVILTSDNILSVQSTILLGRFKSVLINMK